MVEGATATAVQQQCNRPQVGEGAIDTSHAGFLPFGALKAEDCPDKTFSRYLLLNRAPRCAMVDTDVGVTWTYREVDPKHDLRRIANFLLPFYTMNPQGLLGAGPQVGKPGCRWTIRT